jgi:hypothetical protein
LFLVLTSLNACKKDDPATTPLTTSSGCKISKVDYGDGQIDYFTYNSLGQVSEYYNNSKDVNGKTVRSSTTTYSYDSNGLLILAKYGNGMVRKNIRMAMEP